VFFLCVSGVVVRCVLCLFDAFSVCVNEFNDYVFKFGCEVCVCV